MIKTGDIASRLYDRLVGEGKTLLVEEVRIGLGYAGVRIEGDDWRMGLAAVLRDELGHGCSLLAEAGQLAGTSASSLLNDTLEEVLNGLGDPRHVLILGPFHPLVRRGISGSGNAGDPSGRIGCPGCGQSNADYLRGRRNQATSPFPAVHQHGC